MYFPTASITSIPHLPTGTTTFLRAVLLPTFSTAPSLQLACAAQLLILVPQTETSVLAPDGTMAQAAHMGVMKSPVVTQVP